MGTSGKYVVVYDVTDDRERNRVSKTLEGFGFRIQESVFECCLDTRLKNKLKRQLDDLGLGTGFVCIYRVSEHARRITIGTPPPALPDEGYAIVV